MAIRTHPAFAQTDHRPWPLPDCEWVGSMRWENLLFLHWRVDAEAIHACVPDGLKVDTYDGSAWIGIVPFDMKAVTRRGWPAPGFLCDFPEINVRTYVTAGGKPGVWFFSLDVTQPLAAWAARTLFHLPYFTASIEVMEGDDGGVVYRHRRGARRFDATYRPVGTMDAPAGSFEAWSTERYCLYSRDRKGRLYRGEIQHPRWPLEKAGFEIRENTIAMDYPLTAMHPSAMFSRAIDVVVYPLERLD